MSYRKSVALKTFETDMNQLIVELNSLEPNSEAEINYSSKTVELILCSAISL